ncbi:hypothetical protein Fcan01_20248 [Folsomia candida]|uniref:ubiquitinyl hydrolase 1 n=2 Tax=Folsomia candida TaxID=158441 RepID=A0A226DIP0_FOLCA|nr:hypothetical protein Fcan01_20248 [Folsomia candida]
MGYLKYEIIYLVLSKRWRVNYGVDVEGERKMAVPFRAKDVPAKRTEFGHPDVAILLTQLSYYYSGLSDEELEECFYSLDFVTNKEEEYASWIREIRPEFVHQSIQNLSGVNLSDVQQKQTHLFPFLRRNMVVVDFYLGKIVFPKESRTFEKKLVCSAWDLCSEDATLPVTGFSGTNDTSNLLPAPIIQQDLPQLQSTNSELRETILRKENNNVTVLPRGVTARAILTRLIDNNIAILLDSGALMLELDNEGVAKTWLKLLHQCGNSDKEAAVYYDKDELRVKFGTDLEDSVPFHTSYYVDKLDRCVIYLDDVHTRGTDLKIPPPSVACVTIAAGMTRDKMVQACMRMRLLGNGHSIHFFVSDEARNGIDALCQNPSQSPEVSHIMSWVCHNSAEFEKDGLIYWAASGINYSHKRMVETNFAQVGMSPENYVALGEMCCDQEYQTLQVMYGKHRDEINYIDVLKSVIEKKRNEIWDEFLHMGFDISNTISYSNFGQELVTRCKELIPHKAVVSHLLSDEEQEKECEVELEQEEEVIRPPAAEPATHKLEKDVVHFVNHGVTEPGLTSGTILPLHEALKQTTMYEQLPPKENWCKNLAWHVTKDFVSVIISGNKQDKLNEFIRPPNWILTTTKSKSTKVLLISPFEANELIPLIKRGKAATTLRPFAPRLIPLQSTLVDSNKLWLPYTSQDIRLPRNLLPPLYLFSATLYFLDAAEVEEFCNFVGIIPSNGRTPGQEKAFREGKIESGFLLGPFRKEICTNIERICGFTKHPGNFVRHLVETRHGYFPQICHVSKLMVDSVKVSSFEK